jgi:hypothetical protein
VTRLIENLLLVYCSWRLAGVAAASLQYRFGVGQCNIAPALTANTLCNFTTV